MHAHQDHYLLDTTEEIQLFKHSFSISCGQLWWLSVSR